MAHEIGTVSHGTMRDEDLIPTFLDTLESTETRERLIGEFRTVVDALDAGEDLDTEDAGYLTEALFDALGEEAPAGAYFGALEGDGSDYGFWSAEEI